MPEARLSGRDEATQARRRRPCEAGAVADYARISMWCRSRVEAPVAPAFDTPLPLAALRDFVGGLEVPEERLSRPDGDNGAAVLQDAVEERCDEAGTLRGILFEFPDAAEVAQNAIRACRGGPRAAGRYARVRPRPLGGAGCIRRSRGRPSRRGRVAAGVG